MNFPHRRVEKLGVRLHPLYARVADVPLVDEA